MVENDEHVEYISGVGVAVEKRDTKMMKRSIERDIPSSVPGIYVLNE